MDLDGVGRRTTNAMEIVPKSEWTFFSNALSGHGRVVCKAIKPRCKMCRINYLYPSSDVN
jgi:endonuclease-3